MKNILGIIGVVAVNAAIATSVTTPVKSINFEPKTQATSIQVQSKNLDFKAKSTNNQETNSVSSPQNNESDTKVSTASVQVIDPHHAEEQPDNVMSINGDLFSLKSSRGNGDAPNDGKVHQWLNAPTSNWFLLERTTNETNMAGNLEVNSTITVNHKNYQVYKVIDRSNNNDLKTVANLAKLDNSLVLQIHTTANNQESYQFILAK